MSAGTLVSLEEYLNTSYEPDVDYVDGELVDRHVGQTEHSLLQGKIYKFLDTIGEQKGFWAMVDERMRVSGKRVRIPDVCVVLGRRPKEQVLQAPPFLCVEILSPDDRAIDMDEKIADDRAFGVQWIWVVNPKTRSAVIYTQTDARPAVSGILKTEDPEITVSLVDIYALLDRE